MSGVEGASGRELIMLTGGAEEASDGVRISQGSSDSTFIVFNFFLFLSSLIFFLGRGRSKSAETGKAKFSPLRKKKKNRKEIKPVYFKTTHAKPLSDQDLLLQVCLPAEYQKLPSLDDPKKKNKFLVLQFPSKNLILFSPLTTTYQLTLPLLMMVLQHDF